MIQKVEQVIEHEKPHGKGPGKWGGSQPNAGRPKGSVSKRTKALRAIADEAIAAGVTPIEVMLQNMRFYHSEADKLLAKILRDVDKRKSTVALVEALSNLCSFRGQAQSCAVEAAPYVHPRLSAVAVNGTLSAEVVHRIERVLVLDAQGQDAAHPDRARLPPAA